MITGRRTLKEHALDLALVAAIPLLLVAVFELPTATRLELALAYREPTLVSAFTMHYVHLAAGHLLANVAAYLLFVPLTYFLAVHAGRRDVFRIAFVTYLVAFPPVLSALNVLLVRPRVGFGFSGLNMAFLGLLPLMLAAYLHQHAPDTVGYEDAPGLFFVGVGIIAGLTVPSTPLRVSLVALAALMAAFYFRGTLSLDAIERDLFSVVGADGGEFAIAGFLLFALFPFSAFPADPASAGVVVNLYTHLLGYCLGFIAPFATVCLLSPDSPSPPVDRRRASVE